MTVDVRPDGALSSELELELRLLPGVLGLSTDGLEETASLTLLVLERTDELVDSVARLLSAHGLQIEVSLVEVRQAEVEAPARWLEPSGDASSPERVAVDHISFDRAAGVTEVVLVHGAVRATGSASGSPLVAGAQATLNALESLGLDIPFALAAVDHLSLAPDAPIVVCLRPVGSGPERMGVARAKDDWEAACRATLSALNRHLSDPVRTSDPSAPRQG